MGQRLGGNPGAGVLDSEQGVLPLALQRDLQLSPGGVILDAVFHQVEYDLVQVVLQNQEYLLNHKL